MIYTKFRLKLNPEIIEDILSITNGVDLLQQSLMVSSLLEMMKRDCYCDLQVVMKLNGKIIRWNIGEFKSDNLTLEQYYRKVFSNIKQQMGENFQVCDKEIETVFWGNEYSEEYLHFKESDILIQNIGDELIGVTRNNESAKLKAIKIIRGINSFLQSIINNFNAELENVKVMELESRIVAETFEIGDLNENNTKDTVDDSTINQYIPILIELWKKVLDINTCPINKPFFDLGGDSVSVFRLKNLVEEKWNCSLSPIDFFDYPTIKQFGDFLQKSMKEMAGGN